MNIVEEIRKANARTPDQIAIVDREKKVSYSSLFAHILALKNCLQRYGIGEGRRIAFRCTDGAGYIAGSLALLDSGAAIVPVDMSLPISEVDQLLERIDVDGLVFESGALPYDETDRTLKANIKGTKFVWRERKVNRPLPDEIQALRPAFIRFSSGTTGSSKGVALSHKTIYERTEAANDVLKISTEDRVLWVLSMSHHFVVSILLFLRKGATIVVGHQNFPTSIFETAMAGQITLIYASPFHYHLLSTDRSVTAAAMGKVRLAISTAMKLPFKTAKSFAEKFGRYPAEAYGIIEVGLPFINLSPSEKSLGSVGKILPAYKMYLDNVDNDGVGEVLIRGKGMFDAYVSPARLRETVLEDGWFRTGDLGLIDHENNLRIVGRKKTVIICAGMKVFPEEVEGVLNSHAYVKESLVFGAEHPIYGQVPEAKVIPAEGIGIDARELSRLRRYCYAKLPSYSVPKRFETVSKLPRTMSGKLQRHNFYEQ